MWQVKDAIQKQVELEDYMRWGQTPHEKIPELAPIPDSKPTTLSGFRFAVQMFLQP